MISSLTFFLPYVLILYFLYRSLRYPVFMMGIPFLMFLKTSVFFDNVILFRIPVRSFESIDQDPDIFLLAWLIIFWIIFKIRSYSNPETGNNGEQKEINTSSIDYFIYGLVIITFIGLGIVLKEYFDTFKVYDKFFVLLSLFAGYFIIKDLVRNTDIKVLNKFLFSIVIVNTLASVLYFVHQGLHIELYGSAENEYKSIMFEGQILTRTFWYMPVLWFFSISYLLAFIKKAPVINIILLLINLLGVYISYTRSFLVTAALLFILYYLLTGYKNNEIGRSIKSLLIVGIACIVLFLSVSVVLPASTKYFLSRFEELNERPADAHNNNLIYRFYKTQGVMNRMEPEKVVFGYGSVTERQTPFVKTVKIATMDMGWAEVVFRWGFLGLILFSLLYLVSAVKALFLFLKTDGIISQLSLIILLTIVSQVIEGFTSWGIMSPNRFALSLWYFGLLSGLLIAGKNYGKSVNSVLLTENNQH